MHILHIYRLNIAAHHCETVSIKKKYLDFVPHCTSVTTYA